SYLAVTIVDTTTYKYSCDDKTVLFIQNFSYENTEYIWYAVADADDTLDVLKNYVDTDDNEQIEEFYVTYGTSESEAYAKFSYGGSLYLIVSEADTTTLREVLLKII
ncbi:MAG: hypothetical protein LUD27_02860, partial [Clostridia bacterium]|nr:hypothetical protein [Clostridia bacterium]